MTSRLGLLVKKKRIGVWISMVCLFVVALVFIWVENPITPPNDQAQKWKLSAGLLLTGLLLVFLDGLGAWLSRSLAKLDFFAGWTKKPAPVPLPDQDTSPPDVVTACINHLRQQHGLFWRRRVRMFLIVGEPDQIEAIAPGLARQQWLAGQGTLLLLGGSTQSPLEGSFSRWHGLLRGRSLDDVVWALDESQRNDAAAMAVGVRHLQALAHSLHWQLPLHLWQVCSSEWSQKTRERQAVGCWLPAPMAWEPLATRLGMLPGLWRLRGLAQMEAQNRHDFLVRGAQDLQHGGIDRWRQALAPLLGTLTPGVPLRGLWFSLPAPPNQASGNVWPADAAWDVLTAGRSGGYRRLGWSALRIGAVTVLCLMGLWFAGLVLSFASNSFQSTELQRSLTAVQLSGSPDQQLLALNEVMRELGRLDERERHGEPWYQRFGISQTRARLDALWPLYVEANTRLMRDPAVDRLQRQLRAWVNLPADSPKRGAQAAVAYERLKAYLMLVRPEKADPVFLAKVLTESEPTRTGVSPGLWQGLSPGLWQFYAEQLVAHPVWRISTDLKLVAQTRQMLLGQLGQRNGEASLYRQVLESAAHHYPALRLQDMVGDTDARELFSTEASVPGGFTRQAWEERIRDAIDEIAEARREEIDWVLSDNHTDIADELTPDVLKARLTERYFQEYASAWLAFLNSVRWQRAKSLGGVIDQLTLMSDVRQSPLIALMNTLAWQGQAGHRQQALADSLVKSAQKLIGREDAPELDPQLRALAGPLDATFGPLLGLLGKDADNQTGDERLSLQAFLTRVTRVRLKLQQVSNAPDPQGMTQAMAQTVFQGKSVDLTDTQSYGGLIAASLGEEWGGVGRTLFVQPLEQAWQQVLQPSVAGLNRQWQQSIVDHWDTAFTGRFPFAASDSDASLPMLGKMIRADSGRIEQFLQRELSGVLRKEGNRWVVDARHSQGLRVNPQFLAAINQLSHLADVLYTDGGMGLSFELRGKAVRDVVQTTFMLNGARHHYFNQKESWQRFAWPGTGEHPGASLTWTSVHTGDRLFGDFQGTWGLIRLLEKARITPLDDSESRYRVVITAPDGLNLTWHLRTELGAGPASLLTLRDFKLPKKIFLADATQKTVAQNEVYE
jgi:type VI secretion system protein ImpL